MTLCSLLVIAYGDIAYSSPQTLYLCLRGTGRDEKGKGKDRGTGKGGDRGKEGRNEGTRV